MVISILLSHLFGDYILQWDSLSRWKSEALGGVLVHGVVVLAATWLFSLPFDLAWWPWALFIGLTHTLIDGLELPFRKRMAVSNSGVSAVASLIIDQILHLSIITFALVESGYLKLPSLSADILAALTGNRLLTYFLGYAFLTMPAWILVEFLAYGLIKGTAPDFSQAVKNKYICILERGLITTFVLLGQFLLIPLVAVPRILFEWNEFIGSRYDSQYGRLFLTELLTSVTVAVVIGLGLRQI
ncbi:MAG: DUF3307 domain-containing protein [Candidatus Promineifilaceae bacterium]